MKNLFDKSNISNIIDFHIELYHFCIFHDIHINSEYNPNYMNVSFKNALHYSKKIIALLTDEQSMLFLKCMHGETMYQRATSERNYTKSYWHDDDTFS